MTILSSVLKAVTEQERPESYLEIGVRDGDSLFAVLSRGDVKKITLCDTWGGEYGGSNRKNHNHIKEALDKMCYAGDVNYLDGDSKILIPLINDVYDMILIDGDHSDGGSMADLINCWKILRIGGVLVFDDIIHPGHLYLKNVINKFIKERKESIEIIIWNDCDAHGAVVIRKIK